MLVSHRQKFIFLKTKKTAGTALEMALEPWARPENEDADLSHVTKPVETEAGIVGARGSGSVRNKWYNHMTAALVKERLDPRIWDSYDADGKDFVATFAMSATLGFTLPPKTNTK